MLYVEDVIADFAKKVDTARSPLGEYLRADPWRRKFLASLGDAVKAKKTLSSEQSRIFCKLVRENKEAIAELDDEYSERLIDDFLTYGKHRRQPYQSYNLPREVRYLGDNKIGFRFKRSQEIIDDIKALKSRRQSEKESMRWRPHPTYNGAFRMWVVPVTGENVKQVMNIIRKHSFSFDDEVAEYFLLAENSRGQKSAMVHDPISGKFIINVCDNDALAAWVRNVMFGEML